MVSPHFVKRVTDDHLSAGQRNLLKRLPLVDFDDDDEHDAKVASRIVLVFEDACADLFHRCATSSRTVNIGWIFFVNLLQED
jgi:hypothetical protein